MSDIDKYTILHKIRQILEKTRNDIRAMKFSLHEIEIKIDKLENLFHMLQPTETTDTCDEILWLSIPVSPPPPPPPCDAPFSPITKPLSPDWPSQSEELSKNKAF